MSDLTPHWSVSKAVPELAANEVHVWSVDLKEPPVPLPLLQATLSRHEIERANRFHFQKDRDKFLGAHGMMRQILGAYLNTDPAALDFQYQLRGKPELADHPIEFNLSHSGDLALIAVSNAGAVGVDLERETLMAEAEGIARQFFSAQDNAILGRLCGEKRRSMFYRLWTRYEAVLKCTGLGIAECPATQALEFTGGCRELEPASGYFAALAVQSDSFKVHKWHCAGLVSFGVNFRSNWEVACSQ